MKGRWLPSLNTFGSFDGCELVGCSLSDLSNFHPILLRNVYFADHAVPFSLQGDTLSSRCFPFNRLCRLRKN